MMLTKENFAPHSFTPAIIPNVCYLCGDSASGSLHVDWRDRVYDWARGFKDNDRNEDQLMDAVIDDCEHCGGSGKRELDNAELIVYVRDDKVIDVSGLGGLKEHLIQIETLGDDTTTLRFQKVKVIQSPLDQEGPDDSANPSQLVFDEATSPEVIKALSDYKDRLDSRRYLFNNRIEAT